MDISMKYWKIPLQNDSDWKHFLKIGFSWNHKGKLPEKQAIHRSREPFQISTFNSGIGIYLFLSTRRQLWTNTNLSPTFFKYLPLIREEVLVHKSKIYFNLFVEGRQFLRKLKYKTLQTRPKHQYEYLSNSRPLQEKFNICFNWNYVAQRKFVCNVLILILIQDLLLGL